MFLAAIGGLCRAIPGVLVCGFGETLEDGGGFHRPGRTG